jgi:hypothetical protein
MSKKLSQLDYSALIRNEIRESEEEPGNKKIVDRHHRHIGKWVDMLDIIVYVAQNEKIPWTTEELGFPVLPMPTKLRSGFRQVGDYITCVTTQKVGGTHVWLPLVVERKGGKRMKGGNPEDLYGTLMSTSNRSAFMSELERFENDPRFNNGKFVIIAECSYKDFIEYRPAINGRKRNTGFGASINSREATIAKLDELGYQVMFAGSRTRAVRYFKTRVRQSIIQNYELFL